jgi:hypothetical protein
MAAKLLLVFNPSVLEKYQTNIYLKGLEYTYQLNTS